MNNIEHGAVYCYNIISWNIKYCPLSTVIIDDIRCFEMKTGVQAGNVSANYNKQNELTFSLNILCLDFGYKQIKNKQKYSSFTIENFTKHFMDFYLLVSNFVALKPIEFCDHCYIPSYRLSFQHLCINCHIHSLTCTQTCKQEKKTPKKQSKFKRIFSKLLR